MSTKVEKRILVNVPLSVAYNQWTQFEEFPHFMSGIKSVTQLDDKHLHWVAEIAGVKRQWDATILEQVPDKKVAWAATEGATNAGSVTFEDVGGGQTQVHLVLEYEPEGIVEKIGDKLNVVENRAEGDLDRFKEFIESEGYATGAWRGSLGTESGTEEPGIEAAAGSRGDSGKAGISGKVAAGVGLAAAAATAAGVAAAAGAKKAADEKDVEGDVTLTPAVDAVQVSPATDEGAWADTTDAYPAEVTDSRLTEPGVVGDADDTLRGTDRAVDDRP